MGALEELHRSFGDRVAFFVVYVREAHPEDGWVLESNREVGIAVLDPETDGERAAVAESCATQLGMRLPVVLDAVDDEVTRRYGGWPDRLYLVGSDGKIAFQGREGPFGFDPDELRAAIETELARDAAA